MASELVKRYQEYLERFDREIDEVKIGGFAKYGGQLIQKMTYDEFESIYEDYSEALHYYNESLREDHTINDVIVKRVRLGATKLVLKSPV